MGSPRIALAVRESPDWASLADDHAAARPIDPARYANPRRIASFPADIPRLATLWDKYSSIPFFECRRHLKNIATITLQQVTATELISFQDVDTWRAANVENPYLVLFCDDDDWFAPDLADHLSSIDTTDIDAVVFPMARLGLSCGTFASPNGRISDPIGQVRPFAYRYHTNNYALTATAFGKVATAELVEHQQASLSADLAGFNDCHLSSIVATTSKTPCSASLLADVVQDSERFHFGLTRYLAALKSLAVPPAHAWLRVPLWQTIRLFEKSLPRRR